MTPALARFVEALRAGGIAVSPAELLDAAHALDVVGLNDRARVRAALRATLAKQRRSHELFDRIFDAFFAPPRPAPGERGKRRTGAGSGGRGSFRAGRTRAASVSAGRAQGRAAAA